MEGRFDSAHVDVTGRLAAISERCFVPPWKRGGMNRCSGVTNR